MEPVLSPSDLANSVTAFCTMGAGLVTLLLCWLVKAQPKRWLFAYLNIFITGVPTLGWHGWGVVASAGDVATQLWQVWDIGSNLLLAWALQFAVLGDFYPAKTRNRIATASAVINVAAIAFMFYRKVSGAESLALTFGGFGGFLPGEVALIIDALIVLVVFILNAKRVPVSAKPLLRAVTVTFLLGLGLATAHGTTLHGRVLAYHALWHIVGAFGFILFWAFNHVRFNEAGQQARETPSTVAQLDAA